MTPSEYQQLAARTLLKEPGFQIPGDQLMLVWCAIGLAGEAGEVLERLHFQGEVSNSKLIKEIGDAAWYAAGICTVIGIDFSEAIEAGNPVLVVKSCGTSGLASDGESIAITAARIAESVKKGIFHQHGIKPGEVADHIADFMYHLNRICLNAGIRLRDAMELNIAKLRERYPDGFTSEDSKNRIDVTKCQ